MNTPHSSHRTHHHQSGHRLFFFFFFIFSVYLSLHPPKKTVSLWVWALTVPDLEMLCLVPYLSLDHASKASFSKTSHQAQRQLVAPELEPKLSRLSPFASLTLP